MFTLLLQFTPLNICYQEQVITFFNKLPYFGQKHLSNCHISDKIEVQTAYNPTFNTLANVSSYIDNEYLICHINLTLVHIIKL